jgi:hypothetical protein
LGKFCWQPARHPETREVRYRGWQSGRRSTCVAVGRIIGIFPVRRPGVLNFPQLCVLQIREVCDQCADLQPREAIEEAKSQKVTLQKPQRSAKQHLSQACSF